MARDDMVMIEGEIRKATDLAVLLDEGFTEAWLPKSEMGQCWNVDREVTPEELAPGDVVTVEIPKWLAYEKDLI